MEQVQQVADELKEKLEKLSLDQGAKDPRQGNAAASSNDPQPLAGQHLLVEGTSSGGQRSVDQFGEQLGLMGCPDWTPSPETTKAVENAVNLVQELARGGATVDSGGGSAPFCPPPFRRPGCSARGATPRSGQRRAGTLSSERQADYDVEQEVQEEEEQEEEEADGDGGHKVKMELDEQSGQEGTAEQERGGRGAQPPSAPFAIEVFFYPPADSADEISVWMPKTHAATTAFYHRLFYLREEHFRKHGHLEPQNGFERIEAYFVEGMLKQLQKDFEATPRQQDKIAKDKADGMNANRRRERQKGRFNAMLDQGCGRPREDASSAPPPAGNGRKRSAPNKGGRNVAKFILTMGTLETNVLECFSKCLDEGAKKRRWEDTNQGWGRKRRRGDTQSWGTRSVRVAQKRRALTRYATSLTLRHGLQRWNTGAPGIISLLHPVTKELRPLSDVPGVCCGEVPGDRTHGKKKPTISYGASTAGTMIMCTGGSAMNAAARTSAFWRGQARGSAATAPPCSASRAAARNVKSCRTRAIPNSRRRCGAKRKKLKRFTSKKSFREADKCGYERRHAGYCTDNDVWLCNDQGRTSRPEVHGNLSSHRSTLGLWPPPPESRARWRANQMCDWLAKRGSGSRSILSSNWTANATASTANAAASRSFRKISRTARSVSEISKTRY